MNTKKFAIVLSGCGVFDGAEIHETTLSMLAIRKHNCEYEIFAPDIDQFHVINHITGDEMNEKRNVLIESARIARGNIKNLTDLNVQNFDFLFFPGGFGVAKNLCSFAFDGANCKVNKSTAKIITDFSSKGKPIGALCISPTLITKVLGRIEVTIGSDNNTADSIHSMGGHHKTTNHGEVIIDKENKIVTNPCYMLDANILQIAEGAENTVLEMLKL